MKNILKYIVLFLLACVFTVSCNKIKVPTGGEESGLQEVTAVYILNEGSMSGESSLTYHKLLPENKTEKTEDRFLDRNRRTLGSGANDLKIYGIDMWCTLTNSGTIEVVDRMTGISVSGANPTIEVKNQAGQSRKPRFITFDQTAKKAYVSTADGHVLKINAETFRIEGMLAVGRNPEEMCISYRLDSEQNNIPQYLFVCNSGGYSIGNPDNTVSVIDLSTFTVKSTLTVGKNPMRVKFNSDGYIYVMSVGDYSGENSAIYKIDPSELTIVKTFRPQLGGLSKYYFTDFDILNEKAFFIAVDGQTFGGNTLMVMNIETEVAKSFIADMTRIETPYRLAVDKRSGEVIVTDAKDFTGAGEIFRLDNDGKYISHLAGGVMPGSVLLVR